MPVFALFIVFALAVLWPITAFAQDSVQIASTPAQLIAVIASVPFAAACVALVRKAYPKIDGIKTVAVLAMIFTSAAQLLGKYSGSVPAWGWTLIGIVVAAITAMGGTEWIRGSLSKVGTSPLNVSITAKPSSEEQAAPIQPTLPNVPMVLLLVLGVSAAVVHQGCSSWNSSNVKNTTCAVIDAAKQACTVIQFMGEDGKAQEVRVSTSDLAAYGRTAASGGFVKPPAPCSSQVKP